MRLLLGTGLLSLIVLSSRPARAVEDDLPVGKEDPRVVPIVVGDTYYSYHDPQPAGRTATLATTASRHNEVAVNLLAVGARLEHAKLTGSFVLHAGSSVDALHASTPPAVRGNVEVWKHIQLANVGWKMGDLHVEAGIMPSLVGREGFISTENWNYSRAMIADATPYYLTGVRANYRVAPTFLVTATVFNGWDAHGDRNKQKSGQLRFLWEPSDKLSVANAFLAGAEQVPIEGQSTSYRIYDDLVVTYRVHARIQLAIQGTFGTDRNLNVDDLRKPDNKAVQPNPRYYGVALWGRWQFAETTYIALRGEGLDDRYGVLTAAGARNRIEFGPIPGQRMLAGTITLGWQPHPRFLARVEAMHRVADQPFFAGGGTTTYDETVGATGSRATFLTDARRTSTTFVVSAAMSL